MTDPNTPYGQPADPRGNPAQQGQPGQQGHPGQPGAYQPVGQGWNQQGWEQQQPAQPQQPWNQPPGPYGQWGPAGYAYPPKPKTGMSVTALVLGIVGLVASPFPIGSYVAILLAILAVIFGIIGLRRRAGKGMAIAGLILGGLALLVSILMSIFWTHVFQVAADCADRYPEAQGPAFEQCVRDGYRGIIG